MRSDRFASVRTILQNAVAARAFPGAVVEVGGSREVVWREAFGALTYDVASASTRYETIFDLASLTKVIATTTLVLMEVARGRLALADPVRRWIAQWRGNDRDQVTVRDLLEHTSGLTAWLPFYRDCSGRQEFQRAIATLALEYPPRTQALYSDLGFIVLGFILEDVAGRPLSIQFDAVRPYFAPPDQSDDAGTRLMFNPPREWRGQTAPTEVDPWRGRLLIGEVHDENAWALGGAAGHAGLFGTAPAVGRFARAVLFSRREGTSFAGAVPAALLAAAVARSSVPASSRALGWDTMLPTSSCGTGMSKAAIGHTGFTGTSLWIDPMADVYVVLLTNRVHPARANEAIQQVRRQVHDAVMMAVLDLM